MHRSLLTLFMTGLLLALVACGAKEEDKVDLAATLAELKTEAEALAAKRAEMAGKDGEEASALYKEISDQSSEYMEKVANFIYEIDLAQGQAKEGEPAPAKPPEYEAANRMISDEYLVLGQQYIDRQGDYSYAISIYEEALKTDPNYQALLDAKAHAESMKFMTKERFEAAKKGMTEAEVRAAIGPVNSRGIQPYPEKKAKAWFYKNAEGGTTGVFFNEKDGVFKVYKLEYNVSTQE